MQLTPSNSFHAKLQSLVGYDTYKTPDGVKVYMKKNSGTVEVTKDNFVKVSDGKKVSVTGTNGDDKILIENSSIGYIAPGLGNNLTYLNKCEYKPYSRFWGSGSQIVTGGNMFQSHKKGSDTIKINGDFSGGILAQQGAGRGYGDDAESHKDVIIINGNNKGHINVDTHDKVSIKGEKGSIANTTTYVVPM